MRILIAFLALCGALVAGLALQVHYSISTEPCSINEKWDCGVVNRSSYSEIQHIPVAGMGIAGYLLIAWLVRARQRALALIAAIIGCAFSLYLSYIERSVLGVWCLYCVISQAIIALLVLLCLGWLIGAAITERADRKRWGGVRA
jgi:vitamin-K-epoxide reductase (warfarin-sensitive)